MSGNVAAWSAAAASLAVAIASGVADRRRALRSDPDAVGPISWPTVQVFALIAAAIFASIGVNR